MARILYKYVSSKILSYLDNELLRFTQPTEFNDPFECYPRLDENKLTKKLNELTHLTYGNTNGITAQDAIKNTKDKLADFVSEAYEKINKEVGILSLSKNSSNPLMWAHYAEAHKGICIGFNWDSDFFKDLNEGEKSKHTKEVIYTQNRPEIIMSPISQSEAFKIFFTKSKDWKYEQEVRVIATLNQRDSFQANSPGLDINFFKVPHTLIKEVVIGAKAEKSTIQKVTEFCKLKSVKVYESKISESTFYMKRREILI